MKRNLEEQKNRRLLGGRIRMCEKKVVGERPHIKKTPAQKKERKGGDDLLRPSRTEKTRMPPRKGKKWGIANKKNRIRRREAQQDRLTKKTSEKTLNAPYLNMKGETYLGACKKIRHSM